LGGLAIHFKARLTASLIFPTSINPFGSNFISCSLTPPCEYAITGIPKLRLSSDILPKASGSFDKEKTIF